MNTIIKSITVVILLLTMNKTASAQTFTETTQQLTVSGGTLYGTLTLPAGNEKCPAVLIIAGSGPTDRNGNGPGGVNNSLQLFAHQLAASGIASLRYDKRTLGESKFPGYTEDSLRFEQLVNDAKAWIDQLNRNEKFTQVVVAGHSEGSLIGMLAADSSTRFISIAGAGRPADDILKKQLATLPGGLRKKAYACIDSLKTGKTVSDVPALLKPLFRPSVQPYMISWFKYDPAKIIGKFNTAPLIIQGTADLQVGVDDAQLLQTGNILAKLKLIENMNHIFRIITGDKKENARSYKNPDLPISTELIKSIADYILKV
jgi:uncharacterized protein